MIFSGISEKTHEFLVSPPLVGSFNAVCSWFPIVSFLLFVCTSAVDPATDVLSAVAPIHFAGVPIIMASLLLMDILLLQTFLVLL